MNSQTTNSLKVNKLNLTALDNQNVTAKIASDLSTATNNSEGLTPGNLKASVELIKLLSDAIQRNDSNATINEMEIKVRHIGVNLEGD